MWWTVVSRTGDRGGVSHASSSSLSRLQGYSAGGMECGVQDDAWWPQYTVSHAVEKRWGGRVRARLSPLAAQGRVAGRPVCLWYDSSAPTALLQQCCIAALLHCCIAALLHWWIAAQVCHEGAHDHARRHRDGDVRHLHPGAAVCIVGAYSPRAHSAVCVRPRFPKSTDDVHVRMSV